MTVEIIQGLDSYFTFRVGGELFAVNVGQITKILEYTEITRIPNSPRYFKGIINLFGEVVPVFDARLKFGFQEVKRTRETCILILVFDLDGQTVSSGIIVDSVEKVLTIESEKIQSAPVAGKGFNNEFIRGIATHNDEFMVILNLERIFSEEEIKIITSV
jgi:purine-binding chemotaxis protein CheW